MGEEGKIVSTSTETYIEWEIANFFTVSSFETLQETITSPFFSFAGNDDEWSINLFRTWYEFSECLSVYIAHEEGSKNYPVEYHLGLKKRDGTVEQFVRGTFLTYKYSTGFQKFISLSKLRRCKSELAPSDVLTVTCTLRRETTQSVQPIVLNKSNLTSIDTLSENLKVLLGDKESCDTTLKVEDKEYQVHKALLIARSPVFAAAFKHDTSEKQTGVISIQDCDSGSFQHFLEYLYTGKIGEISYRDALCLYSTSDKYDVQELKSFCVEYLVEGLDIENFYDVVVMADKYDETKLLSAAQDFFTDNASKVIESSEWECLMKKNYRLANKILKEMSRERLVDKPSIWKFSKEK